MTKKCQRCETTKDVIRYWSYNICKPCHAKWVKWHMKYIRPLKKLTRTIWETEFEKFLDFGRPEKVIFT